MDPAAFPFRCELSLAPLITFWTQTSAYHEFGRGPIPGIVREKAREDERYKRAIQRTLEESLPVADGVLSPPWAPPDEDYEVFGYSLADTRKFAGTCLMRRLKVIGQLGAQRSELLKNVPTVGEGRALKDFSYKIWSGYMVPKGTPEPVVQRLHDAIGKALQDDGVRTQLAAQSMLPVPPMSLSDSARFFEAETARYRGIAKSINLQPQ